MTVDYVLESQWLVGVVLLEFPCEQSMMTFSRVLGAKLFLRGLD